MHLFRAILVHLFISYINRHGASASPPLLRIFKVVCWKKHTFVHDEWFCGKVQRYANRWYYRRYDHDWCVKCWLNLFAMIFLHMAYTIQGCKMLLQLPKHYPSAMECACTFRLDVYFLYCSPMVHPWRLTHALASLVNKVTSMLEFRIPASALPGTCFLCHWHLELVVLHVVVERARVEDRWRWTYTQQVWFANMRIVSVRYADTWVKRLYMSRGGLSDGRLWHYTKC